MISNEQLIEIFYQAFKKGDYQTMQNCYADVVVFNDAVFVNLNAAEVKAMWEMLCTRGKDVKVNFFNIESGGVKASANWNAIYIFSKTGRRVINIIESEFTIEHGKITRHTDHFNFYRWASQAFGISGLLLGWTPFFKNKVRKEAMKSLRKFMQKR